MRTTTTSGLQSVDAQCQNTGKQCIQKGIMLCVSDTEDEDEVKKQWTHALTLHEECLGAGTQTVRRGVGRAKQERAMNG